MGKLIGMAPKLNLFQFCTHRQWFVLERDWVINFFGMSTFERNRDDGNSEEWDEWNERDILHFLYITCPGLDYKSNFTPGQT